MMFAVWAIQATIHMSARTATQQCPKNEWSLDFGKGASSTRNAMGREIPLILLPVAGLWLLAMIPLGTGKKKDNDPTTIERTVCPPLPMD